MSAPTPYTPREEWGHSLSHGSGFIASLIGLILMLEASTGDIWKLASSWVFGLSMCLLYGCSTLYHAISHDVWKARLRKLDHSAIFVLIAGTYTPFTLISLRDDGGWWLFGVVWAITLGGVILKLLTGARFQKLSLALYLLLGWLVVVMIKPMLAQVPSGSLLWLLAGGLCYSGGVLFYIRKQMPYHHVIWHLFVLAGTICHFVAVYQYLL